MICVKCVSIKIIFVYLQLCELLLNNKKYDDLLEVIVLSMFCFYFMLELRKVKVNKIEKIIVYVILLKLNNIFYELLNCYIFVYMIYKKVWVLDLVL